MKFNEMNLRPELIKALDDLGFENASEIQTQAIPSGLEGQDVLAQAQTGTGKTIAFLLPILQNLTVEQNSLQSLILAPTRELAIQIKDEIEKLTTHMDVNAVAVYGGEQIDRQMRALKTKPAIVVGTPGRTLDLIKRKKLNLSHVRFFVLDEVDEMLNMGFLEDVETIFELMPESKQTLFFSATLPDRIKKITSKFLNEPMHIKVKAKSMTVEKVEQSFMIVKQKRKPAVLKRLLLLRQGQRIIIFAKTKRSCDELHSFLVENKYRAAKIHGDIEQKNRIKTINDFKLRKFDVLVASDVVARGIDIEGVDLVINFELPQDIEYYIHRIGRTARGNAKKGEAITLVSPALYKREFIHYPKELNCDIKEIEVPTNKEVNAILAKNYQEELKQKLNDKEIKEVYLDFANDLLTDQEPQAVINLLLSELYPELAREVDEDLTIGNERDDSKGRKKRNGSNNRSRQGRDGGRGGNRGGRDGNRGGRRRRDDKNAKASGEKTNRNRKPRTRPLKVLEG